jgi:hypothetical protein
VIRRFPLPSPQTLGVVALWSLCAVPAATVCAGQHAALHETDAMASHDRPSAQEGPPYDPNTEATLTGTVEGIRSDGPGRLGWLMRVHTLGLAHQTTNDQQVLLKTDTDTLWIHLGPTAFLRDRKVDIKKRDRVTVTGSRVTLGDSQVVLAREVRRGDTAWSLRDAAGQPLWSTTPPEKRRFWTTTKVVLVVVAAKVALLATVLRH